MGRPKGSRNKDTLLRLEAEKVIDTRSDTEILNAIKERFEVYMGMIRGAADGSITALIASGSAGAGKSHTAESLLEDLKQKIGIRYKILTGAISAIGLYEQAYAMKNAKDVLVLDDVDRIFDEEDGLNLLKAMLDTSLVRNVGWHTFHPIFTGANPIDKEFVYNGSVLFLTNLDWQHYIDRKMGKWHPHMEALMSRCLYLDLRMHSRREVGIWAKYVIEKNQVLQAVQIGCTAAEEKTAIEWVLKHQNDLREMSIRTVMKLGKIIRMCRNKEIKNMSWEAVARATLVRGK